MLQQDIIDSISLMTATGNRLELPKEMLSNYPQVKKALIAAGGKYVKNGFNFPTDAQEIKDRLCGGEAVNDKKKFQFFPTPEPLAQRMVKMAEIGSGMAVLEPSAGNGAIASVILGLSYASASLTMVELNPVMVKELKDKFAYSDSVDQIIEGDFLAYDGDYNFDRIIANPPFTGNQDIEHIMKMYDYLADDGILVTLSSSSWTFGSHKKQVAFREFLESVGAYTEEVPEGTFKESGTNIRTMLIKIVKS